MTGDRFERLRAAMPTAIVRHGTTDLIAPSMVRLAVFSSCQQYRYVLVRRWYPNVPCLVVIGLNPSTADENVNDPTIVRCVRRAIGLGLGGLVMLNLFAFRATDPTKMKAIADPVGPANDAALRIMCADQSMVLAAWGNDGPFRNRASQVVNMLTSVGVTLHALGVTAMQQPIHPLYVPYSTLPTVWKVAT